MVVVRTVVEERASERRLFFDDDDACSFASHFGRFIAQGSGPRRGAGKSGPLKYVL